MNLSKREKNIFITTAVIVLLASCYKFIFEPIYRKWGMLNNEILIKRVRLEKDLRLMQKQDRILQEYSACAAPGDGISKILSHIEKEAFSSGINTANVKPGPAVQKGLYEEYIIELQIEGSLASIYRFASELIKSPLYLTLKKFDLRISKENPAVFKGTLFLSELII